MKLFWKRPSKNQILGITQLKRKIAKATGIPTTKSGRKRKLLNIITNGEYGKFERKRADLTRPYRILKRLLKNK